MRQHPTIKTVHISVTTWCFVVLGILVEGFHQTTKLGECCYWFIYRAVSSFIDAARFQNSATLLVNTNSTMVLK